MRPIAGGIVATESTVDELDSSRSSSSTMDLDLDLDDEDAGRSTEPSLESLLRLTLLAEDTLWACPKRDVLSFGVSNNERLAVMVKDENGSV